MLGVAMRVGEGGGLPAFQDIVLASDGLKGFCYIPEVRAEI